MRGAGLLVAFLALTASAAWAQGEVAPTTQDGPINIKPSAPRPDKDGVYSPGPGISPPLIIDRVAAAYPNDAPADAIQGNSLVSLVIGADGVPTDIQVVRTHGANFDTAAIEALRQSKFEPGTLDGKPVPVRIYARTPFFDDKRPAYSRILLRIGPNGGALPPAQNNANSLRQGDTPPAIVRSVNAEFSDDARRNRIQGIVLVSLLVNEEGIPIDLSVTKGMGHGLDEKALEAVSQYRFRPAMRDGVPIESRITVEVNFRLYTKPQ
jgi:TonB family protein